MAFRIETKGSRKAVIEQLKKAEAAQKDQSQIDSVKDLVISEIGKIDPKFADVLIRVAGDESPTQRNISITVNALK